MSTFLGLSDQQIEELNVETISNPGEILFKTHTRDILRVTHAVEVDAGRAPEKYLACLCHTGRYSAGDVASVHINHDSARERIGHVFPSTSFSEASLWDGSWPSYFAEVGFRKLVNLETIKTYSPLSTIPNEKEVDKTLDEVFSDEVAVLVLSKEATKKLRMSLFEIELSLIHGGIYPLGRRVQGSFPEPNKRPTGNYNLKKLSKIFAREASAFVDLVRRADLDQTGVGAFLIYYQAIEYCIDHILNWSIREIATSSANAWDIREQLSKATNEKHRISKLESIYLSNAKESSVFSSLSEVARRFISLVSDEDTSGWTWGQLVYRARNIIVHNQLSLLRAEGLEEVARVNKELRKVCLEIFVHFQSR